MSWVSHLKTNVMMVSVVLLEPLMALLCRYAKHQPWKYTRVCCKASNKCFPMLTCRISSEVKPTGSWKRQKGQLSGSFQPKLCQLFHKHLWLTTLKTRRRGERQRKCLKVKSTCVPVCLLCLILFRFSKKLLAVVGKINLCTDRWALKFSLLRQVCWDGPELVLNAKF